MIKVLIVSILLFCMVNSQVSKTNNQNTQELQNLKNTIKQYIPSQISQQITSTFKEVAQSKSNATTDSTKSAQNKNKTVQDSKRRWGNRKNKTHSWNHNKTKHEHNQSRIPHNLPSNETLKIWFVKFNQLTDENLGKIHNFEDKISKNDYKISNITQVLTKSDSKNENNSQNSKTTQGPFIVTCKTAEDCKPYFKGIISEKITVACSSAGKCQLN